MKQKYLFLNKKPMELTTNQPKKNCKTCKPLSSKSNWFWLILGFYMFFSSIYGTIQLIKNLF